MSAATNSQLAEALARPETARSLTLPIVDSPLDPLDGISRARIARAEAKAEIVAKFRAFRNRHSARTLAVTLEFFVTSYNRSQIEVSAATRELYPTIAVPTLQRDWRCFEKSGIAGLIPGHKGSKRIVDLNPRMRDFVISVIAHNPRVRARFLLDAIEIRFPKDRLPKLRTVGDFVRNWKRDNRALFQRVKDPDGWKNRHMLALGTMDAGITRVGQLWEIDGTPADSYVLGTVETPGGRLHLLAAIDVHSRRIVAHLAPVESSDALAGLLTKAVPILGVPEAIRHDNGAGFVSARTQRALARLGIASIGTPAYRGDRKPFVERGFRIILHSFFENVPGFIGHSVVQAAEIRSRHSFAKRRGERRKMRNLYRIELTAPELQELLDAWLEHIYAKRVHSGLGRTPHEVFAEAERRGQVHRVADDRTLDLLLGEDGVAVIGKKGLRISNAFYWDNVLIEYIGHAVQYVRTRDAGRVIVYTADAAPKFVCIAVDPESAGLDREVLALAAKQRQSKVMHEGIEELRALKRKHKPEKVFREIIDHAVARSHSALRLRAPEADGGKVLALPWSGSAIKAASAALAALDTPSVPEPHDEEILREGDLALQEMERRRELRELQRARRAKRRSSVQRF